MRSDLLGNTCALTTFRSDHFQFAYWLTFDRLLLGRTTLPVSSPKVGRASELPSAVNLAFQGNFSPDVLPTLGIPHLYLHPDGIEFYGQVSFLKAAIRFSDKVTTVSPTYASEVLASEFSCGMDGVLRQRRKSFSGVLNGIDAYCWNPATDPCLAKPYDA